jgi:hypothetical protein
LIQKVASVNRDFDSEVVHEISGVAPITELITACGEGEDTVTDYNEAEGDIATPDCENI